MKPARPVPIYVKFAREPVLGVEPGEQVRGWARVWTSLFGAMAEQNALFDVVGLVIARWEFLGGLYRGSDGGTGVADALAYSRKFLFPVNRNYANTEKLVDRTDPSERFDLFTMLRNKPLHGLVPAGVATEDCAKVVTWWMGFSGISAANHMTVDVDGGLHVDAREMCAELARSMNLFADYLDANTDVIDGRSPQARWRRGFWARFQPKFMPGPEWMALGVAEGVPG
jgi:hypothetical protein